MSIVTALLHNLRLRPLTHRPEDTVPAPDGYRGSLQHDLTRCTGCATCVYVCSPSAITLRRADDQAVAWHYDASCCTFCGRCAEFCPTQALAFSPEPLPAVSDRSQHQLTHWLEQRPCRRCGRPITPLPPPTLVRLYGTPLPAEIAAQQELCEACRNRLAGETLKRSYLGKRSRDER